LISGSALVDGRNRREACLALGIVPNYVLLDGQDPVTYILSANINWWHMSKGQRAMAVVRICFETKQSVREGAKQSGTSAGRLGYAMAVINHAPDLADQVLSGFLSLDADTYESRFNALKAEAPDLAELVTDGQLTFEEAQAALEQRLIEIRREKIRVAKRPNGSRNPCFIPWPVSLLLGFRSGKRGVFDLPTPVPWRIIAIGIVVPEDPAGSSVREDQLKMIGTIPLLSRKSANTAIQGT
jgi:hypothetical protein